MHGPSPHDFQDTRIWQRTYLNVGLLALLLLVVLFVGIHLYSERLVETELRNRARAHFSSVLMMRRWNSDHGGVYVEKRPGVESSPYLENTDILSSEGKTYALRNPATMTREISEIAREDESFQFHMSSLKPINPENLADPFEEQALRRFEQGSPEEFAWVETPEHSYYRYMAPLVTEESCLECHADQGYQVGDIRGGISLRLNIDTTVRSMWQLRWIISGLFLLTSLIFLGVIYVCLRKSREKLAVFQQRMQEMALKDELSGLHNRRFLFRQLEDELARARRFHAPLSCLMIDLDRFKSINDSYGHPAGDRVIRTTAELLKQNSRQVDTLARYGGEEFVLLMAGADLPAAITAAETHRKRIEAARILSEDGTEIRVTASIGVATLSAEMRRSDKGVGLLLKEADNALYRAKERGRNRVEAALDENHAGVDDN